MFFYLQCNVFNIYGLMNTKKLIHNRKETDEYRVGIELLKVQMCQ